MSTRNRYLFLGRKLGRDRSRYNRYPDPVRNCLSEATCGWAFLQNQAETFRGRAKL